MNFTKGEWWAEFIQLPNKQQWEIRATTEHPLIQHIADIGKPTDGSEAVANAHLIAAAPENFEANSETLRTFRDLRDNHEALWNHIIDEYPGIVNHWDRVKKALAKAEGGGNENTPRS